VLDQIDADIMSSKTSTIGTRDPKKDFLEMVERRDQDMFLIAMQQLENIIFQLVRDSIDDQLYSKALDCINESRKVCIKEAHPDDWNTMLKHIKITMSEGSRNDFWVNIKIRNITLITVDECSGTSVTKDEADKFLQDTLSKTPATAPIVEAVDNLLDELE
jgi:ATP-dependent DNA helicase 2 subunit 2